MRFGIGYDVHRLVSGRALILGGVKVPFDLGLDGHSDADVLVHAIMDGLLGAAGLGDIGKHFPDTDPQYKGISSLKLLEHVNLTLKRNNFNVNNIDSVIVAQRPKLAPFIEEMRNNISKILDIPCEIVNVKATTTEGLGFAGTGEGIAAYAIASIKDFTT
ncbi:MAG TPA: 2-C-methyl-D-erythritol 2,4-cyclodiphosphate synthase [Desulfobacteria bacterium]|nr:2-C-methyl-D-erythritol 2,4-cyclodiphosphate synthase [Desulfobacteria bacterium]